MIDWFLLAAGFILLYLGGEALLRGALAAGERFRMPPLLVGLVLVGLGTSAPELAVGIDAALTGHGDLAVGNVLGSNIVNFALVLGLAAAFRTLPITRALARRDLPALAGLTLASAWFVWDASLTRIEGMVLMILLAAALLYAMFTDAGAHELTSSPGASPSSGAPIWRTVGGLALGVGLLVLGAEATVRGGIGLAQHFGVSEALIALTVTALGTGLPEIAATLVAIARNHVGIALGNVVGSNMINLGLVLGMSAVIAPLSAEGISWLPVVILCGLTAFIVALAQVPRGIRRWTGWALLSAFGAYNVSLLTV